MKKTIVKVESEYVAPEIEILNIAAESDVLSSSNEEIGDDPEIPGN